MLPKTLRDFSGFIDGVGYAGRIKEGTPPTIALQVEEYLAGGMAAPVDIDMGAMEKMECSMTFSETSRALLSHIGKPDVPLTLRGAQRGPNVTAESVIYQMRGLLREITPGTWQRGSVPDKQLTFTAHYLKVSVADQPVIEIDAENMVRWIAGTDQLADVRRALGL
ncbi:phage major tail tube protein [Tepidicaulis sp. LMO-SS28]|uniref:phage major tail tube protein n=1 Tax=Tepidicaulis sp. LMO-SS28 TaxID=3447455 RepID=UPI003EE2271F